MPEQKAPAPPPPPESLEKRVERLEDFYFEVAERLARLETRVELIASQIATLMNQMATKADKADIAQMATKADIAPMATKADMAALETRMIKWFVGTAVTLAGLAFAAGKFVH
jgi:glutathione S-transferase